MFCFEWWKKRAFKSPHQKQQISEIKKIKWCVIMLHWANVLSHASQYATSKNRAKSSQFSVCAFKCQIICGNQHCVWLVHLLLIFQSDECNMWFYGCVMLVLTASSDCNCVYVFKILGCIFQHTHTHRYENCTSKHRTQQNCTN